VSPADPAAFIGYDNKLVYEFFELELNRNREGAKDAKN
jgi:hypothetical protein